MFNFDRSPVFDCFDTFAITGRAETADVEVTRTSARSAVLRSAASQLIRGDVTQTKPCALEARESELFCELRTRSQHIFGVRGHDESRVPFVGATSSRLELLSHVSVLVSTDNLLWRVRPQDAVHIQGLAQPRRGMGEDGRRLGEKEDPRVRQQQDPFASSTVSRCYTHLSFSLSRVSLSARLACSSPSRLFVRTNDSSARPLHDAAHSCYSNVYIDPTDSSVCLHTSASILSLFPSCAR